MHRRSVFQLLIGLLVVVTSWTASAVTVDTVPIGDVGNPNDPGTGNRYGGVNHAYRIGTTEVTNAQYAEFLNAKAKSDPLGLYNVQMGTSAFGGITLSGVSGSFIYATKANMADKPVNFVSWYDSIRFANWLNNGQGNGDTETGAYTILGGTAKPSNAASITRNAGASWFLPTDNEWYKAAYYQPAAQGGDADNYWSYPTKSNSPPTAATATSVGNIRFPGTNIANYGHGAAWNDQQGNVTTVGSAGPLSQSYYGTSDQGGNLRERTETFAGSFPVTRGGRFDSDSSELKSNPRYVSDAPGEYADTGFRVATVPEPSSVVLALTACGLLLGRRIRFRKPARLHSSI